MREVYSRASRALVTHMLRLLGKSYIKALGSKRRYYERLLAYFLSLLGRIITPWDLALGNKNFSLPKLWAAEKGPVARSPCRAYGLILKGLRV